MGAELLSSKDCLRTVKTYHEKASIRPLSILSPASRSVRKDVSASSWSMDKNFMLCVKMTKKLRWGCSNAGRYAMRYLRPAVNCNASRNV